jgi:hypothetical protein
MCNVFNVSQHTIMDQSFSQSLKIIDRSSYTTLSFERMTPLQATFTPGPFDVICGRGKVAKNHSGNRHFRNKVQEALLEYSRSDFKLGKSMIVSDIVESVRRGSPLGGFVKWCSCSCIKTNDEEDHEHGGGGQWFEVGDHLAREKVGQSFRDLLHVQYKSSTKAKRKRRTEEVNEFEVDMEQIASSNLSVRQHSKKLQMSLEQAVVVGVKKVSDMQVLRLFTNTNIELLQALKCDSRFQQELKRLNGQQQQEQQTTTGDYSSNCDI